MITVGGAGLALRLLGEAANLDALSLLGHLALIVGAPMIIGLFVRARVARLARFEDSLARLSIALVTLLVWLVASQVRSRGATWRRGCPPPLPRGLRCLGGGPGLAGTQAVATAVL